MGRNLRKRENVSLSNMPELSAEQLRYRCPLDTFKFKTTEEIDAPFEIIGQERAIKAIQLGLMVPSRGYNILVQGLTGTGKKTTVKSIALPRSRRISVT